MTAIDLDIDRVTEKIQHFIDGNLDGLTVYAFALQEAARSCIMAGLKKKLEIASKIAQDAPKMIEEGDNGVIAEALEFIKTSDSIDADYKLPWE